jgi:hypothetical protein
MSLTWDKFLWTDFCTDLYVEALAPLPPHDCIGDKTFKVQWYDKDAALIQDNWWAYKRRHIRDWTLSAMQKHMEKVAACKPDRQPSPETKPHQDFVLWFLSL